MHEKFKVKQGRLLLYLLKQNKLNCRNTIDHAKEMFKSNSTRHEYNRGAKLPIDYNSVMKISDGNSARGLLINKHLPVDQQMSNESTSSFGNRVNETISTASSAV